MKKLVFVLVLTLGFAYVQAQEVYNSSGKPGYHKKTTHKKGYDPSRLIFGGGITFDLGDGYVDAGIAPMLGYRFTKSFEAGIGVGYLYDKQPDLYFSNNPYTPSYSDNESILYPSLWARYIIWRGIYATTQLEYDFINLSGPIDNYGDRETVNVNATCLLLGPGYKQPLGGRASFFIEVLYDVLQEKHTPYPSTLVPRVGIAVGL